MALVDVFAQVFLGVTIFVTLSTVMSIVTIMHVAYMGVKHTFNCESQVTFIAFMFILAYIFIHGPLCMPDREFVGHNIPMFFSASSMICLDVIV